MIDHIGIKVSEYKVSRKFYEAALKPLGFRVGFESEKAGVAGFFGPDREGIWISQGTPRPAIHIAVRVGDRATVESFYQAAIAAGGRDNGAPGPGPEYTPDYYGAFVLDPDGYNVEAVCHRPA